MQWQSNYWQFLDVLASVKPYMWIEFSHFFQSALPENPGCITGESDCLYQWKWFDGIVSISSKSIMSCHINIKCHMSSVKYKCKMPNFKWQMSKVKSQNSNAKISKYKNVKISKCLNVSYQNEKGSTNFKKSKNVRNIKNFKW